MRPIYAEEQAMRRTIGWTVVLGVFFALAVSAVADRALAQVPLPAPGDDEAGYDELQLPAPPQNGSHPPQLRDFSQAFLGVTFEPQIRNAAVARSVTADSPADQAGLRAGDTIEMVNGRRITSYDEVLRIVSELRPGDVLDIDVTRRVSVSARAVLGAQPIEQRQTAGYRMGPESLPDPAGYQPQQRVTVLQYDAERASPRPTYNVPENRRSDVNRNDRPQQRERGFRGRFSRRRG
jgi:membrane-associated protease RseP (regulator of RpoE activity)